MINKKIISTVCAAAMVASSMAAFAVTASAAGEEVLWSNTFNTYENTVAHQTNSDGVGNVLIDGSSIANNEYKGIGGLKLYTTNRADDSSYYQINAVAEGSEDKYLQTQTSRFARQGAGAYMKFEETYAPTTEKELVLAFKLMEKNDGGTTYDNKFSIGNTVLDMDEMGICLGDWHDIKVVVSASGTTVYADGEAAPLATSSDKAISTISFNSYIDGAIANDAVKSSTHVFGYPTWGINDMVVYLAEDGLASEVPPAQDGGDVEITYETVPQPELPAKVDKLPINKLAGDSFDSEVPHRYIYIDKGGESVYDAFNTVKLSVGPASDATGDTNWSSVGNAKTDPALGNNLFLRANNMARSTSNRGPKMQFKYNTIEERQAIVASFAARLNASDTAPSELIFSGDLVASESKGNLASPLAMITTDAEAESGVYACDNPLVKIAEGGTNIVEVADGEWFVVTVIGYRSEGKMATAKIAVTTDPGTEFENTTYIFGAEDAYAEIKDSTKSGVTTLPYISFRSGNDSDYGVSNTSVDIDNIVVGISGEANYPLPTATYTVTDGDIKINTDGVEGNAIVIASTYDEEGRLETVDTATVALGAGTEYTVDLTQINLNADKFVVLIRNADNSKMGVATLADASNSTFPPAA